MKPIDAALDAAMGVTKILDEPVRDWLARVLAARYKKGPDLTESLSRPAYANPGARDTGVHGFLEGNHLHFNAIPTALCCRI